ncbi:sensor histidine kinase [Streptomyces doudnae]|uniref:histidine kinase n=1 Tax=Streptomyces doudnae TaxID=3075536 RepID=A0ABD5EET8_9ACTN|nr:ATP-binding protein [Streptomyces sp. DSM 41981]MDT0433178.1 ATP-binding protein [Streptomyces sp. DSM 41981]
MAHLRAPAPRADRREGGRHGRPAARTAPVLPEAHIRSQLRRLAVLPPTAVALSACAAVLFTVRSTGAQPGLALWGVLAGAFSVALAGILIAAVAADRAARALSDRVLALRRGSARGEADLRALVTALRRGETPPARAPRGGPPDDADDLDLLACDLARAHDGAVTAVVQAAQLSSQAGDEQKLEVFVNLARRLQSLVHREISTLDELENSIEDPDLLKGLFHVDHLATRIRRHSENLAVLGGAVSRRQWSHPVPMTEVLRSAVAEVEQYSRVRLVPPVSGTLRGHAVADVIHLLAELVENATVFSAPHTQVLLRATLVTSGLAVEVEDRGLGMPLAEQRKMNALLADPDQVNVGHLLADGRIGLFVVSQLARRHGIEVRLQSNIYGGVQAVLVVPQELLGADAATVAGGTGGLLVGDGWADASLTGTGTGAGTGTGSHRAAGGWNDAAHRTADAVPAGAGDYGRAGTRPDAHTAGPGGHAAAGMRPDAHMAAGGGHPTADARPDILAAGTGGHPAGAGYFGAVPQDIPPGADPLPVRDAHQERANPAEAVPGIGPDHRRLLAERPAEPLTPRGGPQPGVQDKPHLPRRRAQEHLVPELRGGPLPRPADEPPVDHDPGLMAAFRRGVGLAEAQQHLKGDNRDPGILRMESAYTGPVEMDRESLLAGHAPLEVRPTGPGARTPGPAHARTVPGPGPAHGASDPHAGAARAAAVPRPGQTHDAARAAAAVPRPAPAHDTTVPHPPPTADHPHGPDPAALDVTTVGPARPADAPTASARGGAVFHRHDGNPGAG